MSPPQQKVLAALTAAKPTPIEPQERVEAWLHDGYSRRWRRRVGFAEPLTLGEFRVVYLGAESMFPPSPPLSEVAESVSSYKTACSRLMPTGSLLRELDAGYEADVSQRSETSGTFSVTEADTLATSVSDAVWVDHDADASSEIDSDDGSTSEDCEETQALVDADVVDGESVESSTNSEPPRHAMNASPAVERLALLDRY